MTNIATYMLELEDGTHNITIKPVNQTIPGGNLYSTGIFKLNEGNVGMGDIVFDDDMNQWEYTGLGALTHENASEIAEFIRNYREPDNESV